MRFSPIVPICAAGLLTFGVSQTLSPTAYAQPATLVPALRASVESLHAKQTVSGVELAGQLINTGRQALTYTSVVFVFTDAAGKEVGRGNGYLTAGPVAPGQSAGLRAALPKMPAFAKVSLRLRESGQTVAVEAPAAQPLPAQLSASRHTTVW